MRTKLHRWPWSKGLGAGNTGFPYFSQFTVALAHKQLGWYATYPSRPCQFSICCKINPWKTTQQPGEEEGKEARALDSACVPHATGEADHSGLSEQNGCCAVLPPRAGPALPRGGRAPRAARRREDGTCQRSPGTRRTVPLSGGSRPPPRQRKPTDMV